MFALAYVTSHKQSKRPALPAGVSFWAVAGIAFLALAANTAASPPLAEARHPGGAAADGRS